MEKETLRKRLIEEHEEEEKKKIKKTGDITAEDFSGWSKREQWEWIMAFTLENVIVPEPQIMANDELASKRAAELFEVLSQTSHIIPRTLNGMTPEERHDKAMRQIHRLETFFKNFKE